MRAPPDLLRAPAAFVTHSAGFKPIQSWYDSNGQNTASASCGGTTGTKCSGYAVVTKNSAMSMSSAHYP